MHNKPQPSLLISAILLDVTMLWSIVVAVALVVDLVLPQSMDHFFHIGTLFIVLFFLLFLCIITLPKKEKTPPEKPTQKRLWLFIAGTALLFLFTLHTISLISILLIIGTFIVFVIIAQKTLP